MKTESEDYKRGQADQIKADAERFVLDTTLDAFKAKQSRRDANAEHVDRLDSDNDGSRVSNAVDAMKKRNEAARKAGR